jgi:exopolysaccharide biosynthesis protein
MKPLLKKLAAFIAAALVMNGGASDMAAASPLLSDTLQIRTVKIGDLTIHTIGRYDITVVKIPEISSYLSVHKPVAPLERIAQDSNYALVINGSYFEGYDEERGFVHAGYLKIHDTVMENLKEDKQLSRLFSYNSRKKTVRFFGLNDLEATNGDDLVFQTGPQIIANDRIDTASIRSSLNGKGRYLRTAFASVDGKDLYVIAALTAVPLEELGRILLVSGIFGKGLNVINFDGGPSTVLCVNGHPEFSFHAEKILPILLCVKKTLTP